MMRSEKRPYTNSPPKLWPCVVLCVLCVSAVRQLHAADNGLVAHWDFQEGQGDVLHDRSGNNNHGKIHGAEWAKSGDKCVLKFDGKDDYVDCGNRPSLNLTDAVSVEAWFRPRGLPPTGVEPGLAGKGIGPYGLTYYATARCYWYLRPKIQNCIADARPGAWHHAVGTFDGVTSRLHVDGRMRFSRAAGARIKLATGKNFYIGGGFGWGEVKEYSFGGMIGGVRVYNRALSGQEIRDLFEEGRKSCGLDISVSALVYRVTGKLVAVVDRGLGVVPAKAVTTVDIVRRGAQKPIRSKRVEWVPGSEVTEAILNAADLPTGEYELRALVVGAAGRKIAAATTTFLWPDKPSLPGAKVLNNMVVELLNVGRSRQADQKHEFVNPRDGWVFFSSTARVKGAGKVALTLESGAGEETPVLLHEEGGKGTLEAMRFLRAGTYRLSAEVTGKASLTGLVVRAIPETAYCFLPTDPYVKAYGPYDRAFLEKDVLPNVNCMVSENYGSFPKTPEFQDFVRQWRKSGRKWIVRRGGVPGIHSLKNETLTAEKASQYWAQDGAFRDPLVDGIVVDEYGGGEDKRFLIWAEAVKKLHATFPGKSFYPWCGGLCSGEPGKAFVKVLMKAGDRFAWKQYLKEKPTLADARSFVHVRLIQPMLGWREVPGAERHVIVCFGHLLSAPTETLSADPGVDFKVYMDMQFNVLANDPAFWDLGGVMEYHARFGDEEYIRWAGKLFRHYCIEGKTGMLSDE